MNLGEAIGGQAGGTQPTETPNTKTDAKDLKKRKAEVEVEGNDTLEPYDEEGLKKLRLAKKKQIEYNNDQLDNHNLPGRHDNRYAEYKLEQKTAALESEKEKCKSKKLYSSPSGQKLRGAGAASFYKVEAMQAKERHGLKHWISCVAGKCRNSSVSSFYPKVM